ncbi:SRPBCC family protein [Bradyrhizobium sp. UFLA05-109]
MIPNRSILAAIAVLVASTISVSALESTVTARSSLSLEALWQTVGDFCATALWNPVVEDCVLSTDGKMRTLSLFEGRKVEQVLENWDGANHSYAFSGALGLSEVNVHSKVSVIAVGKGSALQLTVTYEAKGVSDADAKRAVDGLIFRALCVSGPLRCSNDQQRVSAEIVAIPDSQWSPLVLQGYLRRSNSPAPAPAVILVHGCAGFADMIDQNWGQKINSWGYVTLTIDSFGRRGVKNTCRSGPLFDNDQDPYRGLNYLIQQKLIDPTRVALVGFDGSPALSSVTRGPVENAFKGKFRGVAALYPNCAAIKGPMTVPTLILTGELDDSAPPEVCRRLANGADDIGISRQKADGAGVRLIVYPGAYAGFDLSFLRAPVLYMGHRVEFNKSAMEQASDALREFLASITKL